MMLTITHTSLYNCRIAKGSDQKSIQKIPILNLKLQESGNTLLQLQKDAEIQPRVAEVAEGLKFSSPEKISAVVRYAISERRCSSTGRRGRVFVSSAMTGKPGLPDPPEGGRVYDRQELAVGDRLCCLSRDREVPAKTPVT
jgi:hypothetical protein